MSPVFGEELEILVSPVIPRLAPSGEPTGTLIIRDIHHSFVWEAATDPIIGLDFVEGNTYHIIAKKTDNFQLLGDKEYELVETIKVFKPHKPYSWKGLCVPGYISIHNTCSFAFRCSEYAYPGKPCEISMRSSEYLKPIHQHKVGIAPQDTICLESLRLVLNHENMPYCVKPSSTEKMLERGFTIGKINNDSPYN